jgi:hypothetical protein
MSTRHSHLLSLASFGWRTNVRMSRKASARSKLALSDPSESWLASSVHARNWPAWCRVPARVFAGAMSAIVLEDGFMHGRGTF